MEQMPSSICLMSTASLENFPYNSRTQFTNLLPVPLRKRDSSTGLYIRLRAIAISCDRDTEMLDDPYSDHLKVNLHELEHQRTGNQFDHCAGSFEYPPKTALAQNTGYAYHAFNRTPFLKVRFDQVSKLEVTITNGIGQLVQGIYTGPPTIVLFDVSDKMEADNFTITCSSKHPELFVGNKLTEFTSPLHSQMDLSQHQVALVNVVYPPSLSESTVATMTVGDSVFSYTLEDFDYTHEFITKVREDLRLSPYRDILYFSTIDRRGRLYGRTCLGRVGGRAANEGHPRELLVSFSNTFTIACGQLHDFRSRSVLRPGRLIIFRGSPDINLAKPNPVATLHSDIVRNGIIGNRNANLLACVPVLTDRTAGRSRLYETSQLIYYDIVQRPVSTISFLFTNPDGSSRKFHCNEAARFDNISITLSFRLKKTAWLKQLMASQDQQQQQQ